MPPRHTGTVLAGTDLAGFDSEDIGHVNRVASFGAGGIAAGFDYATTGTTTVNLVDFRMFGLESTHGTFSGGLLELGIGGGGSMARFGGGGHAMDVAGAMQGFETFAFNNAVRRYERTGDIDVLKDYTDTTDAGVLLRSNYSFGNQAAVAQARSIAKGGTLLRVGGKLSDEGSDNHLGLTTIEDGRRVVHLATLGKEGDIASQLQAGTVLQWEAHRDGRNTGLAGQWFETTAAAAAMTTMAQNVDASDRYGQVFELTGEQMEIARAFDAGGVKGLMAHVAEHYDFAEGDYLRRVNERTGQYGVRPANRIESLLPGLFGGPETSDRQGLDSANIQAALQGVQTLGEVAGYLHGAGATALAPLAFAGDLAGLIDEGLRFGNAFGPDEASGLVIDGDIVNLNASLGGLLQPALRAGSLHDFAWFGNDPDQYHEDAVDAVVFKFAKEHGIQLGGEISDLENPADAEAAGDQMMRSAFMIAHAKLGLGLSDEQTLFLLKGGAGPQVRLGNMRYTLDMTGFEDLNTGPVPSDQSNFEQVRDINTVLQGDAFYNNPFDPPGTMGEWFFDSATDKRYWEFTARRALSDLRRQQDNSAFLWEIIDAAY